MTKKNRYGSNYFEDESNNFEHIGGDKQGDSYNENYYGKKKKRNYQKRRRDRERQRQQGY